MDLKTPVKKLTSHHLSAILIPPSPFMKKLGYGTGVAVYKFERSPVACQNRSPWAVKKLLRKRITTTVYSKRLEDEANILRRLDHPHIVGFRAFVKGASADTTCLVMEDCNKSLGDMIEQRSELIALPYPAKSIMKVALDISEALNYLHTQALILHCDVKSYNILVKGNFETCKLCDFGICLPLKVDGEIDHEKAGDDAEYIGTRAWTAPEIVNYPQVITTKADIYSYGLVMWEMLALSPPCARIADESYRLTAELEEDEEHDGFGKRPELPNCELDDSYKYVLEIFHCCTEQNHLERPSAEVLTISIPEMIKDLALVENFD